MAAEKKEENPADIMEYRMLGSTGLKVSCLGFGSMTFESTEHAVELMSAVRKYGVNLFDNAELYGSPCGQAETYFGEALKQLQAKDPKLWRRSDLVITTKFFFGPGFGDEPNDPMRPYGQNESGLSRKHLVEAINASLKRLQLEYVDIVMAHRYDPLTPMLEVVRGFTDMIRSGKAFYWGTSMWTPQKITEAYWVAKVHNLIPPVVEQPMYNMFFRSKVELDLKPMFEKPYGIGTTTWSPLAMGLLTGKYVKEIPKGSRMDPKAGGNLSKWGIGVNQKNNAKVAKLMEIAKEMDVSMVALALGWVLKNKNVSTCLLGGRKAHQLEQNMAAIPTAMKLNKDLLDRIDAILDNKPKPPQEMNFMRVKKYLTNPL